MALIITDPKKIEHESFRIVSEFLKDTKFPQHQKDVVQRVIHATAEPGYAKDIIFHPKAVEAALSAIRLGKNIIVDSNMIKAGINKNWLSNFNNKVVCLISDKDVIRESKKLNITRAMLAMRKSAAAMYGSIVAIGNAPTALFKVCDMIEKNEARPGLVIGVPVGFVGAIESKKRLAGMGIPYITNKTRYGGSSAAIAIINALLKIAKREEVKEAIK